MYIDVFIAIAEELTSKMHIESMTEFLPRIYYFVIFYIICPPTINIYNTTNKH